MAAELFQDTLEEDDAVFRYYKEFCWTEAQCPGSPELPPVSVVMYPDAYAWMREQGCDIAAHGTELDWLTFFYRLNNKTPDALTLLEIADVYQLQCGGVCDAGDDISYAMLEDEVRDTYGNDSADYMHGLGIAHGVNY